MITMTYQYTPLWGSMLGQKGSNEGEYSYPWRVCTDKDGYIYVCDCGNEINIIYVVRKSYFIIFGSRVI